MLAPGSSKASLGSAASRKIRDLEDKVEASLIWDLEVTTREVVLAVGDEEEDGRAKDLCLVLPYCNVQFAGSVVLRIMVRIWRRFTCIQSVLAIPLRMIFETMSLSYSQLEIRGKGAVAGGRAADLH